LISDFKELGIEVLNPVQSTAAGMDTKGLKIKHGQDIVFWGGIDTQNTLPFKKPADVFKEVKDKIEDLAPGGGFLLAPCHDIQANTPPENIEALFKAALQYGSKI
jgi:uroporphyrinogen decarboxylase